ncbi:hypothetical protein CK203_020932 [Vitis vinifera]|uniref:GAG-pre-integrase domain-containing protein n=1 Tax=Vitis vinifera TaxID=29760 RepID=A0A438JX73_VITVI|nr:hypothetical protein CK203_020932 [Vitis vinifera]
MVEKILVTVPERFEASITTLENTKDLSMITLVELLNALQAQEQRRVMRQDYAIEGALPVKHHVSARNNKNKKDQNYKVVFEDKSCLIKDAVGQDIFKVKMREKNFALDPLEDEKIAFPIKENITEVWHKRFGHYHHQGVLQMKSKMMANNLPNLDDHIPNCKACQFGKQNRKPFPKVT